MFWLLLIVDFLVMLLLAALLLLVIRGLAKAVKTRLKKDFAESLSVYDDVIEKREADLEAIRRAEASLRKPPAHMGPAKEAPATGGSTPVSAAYVTGDFIQTYQQVRQAFSFEPEAVVKAVADVAPSATSTSASCDAARELRSMLDHDTVYDLLVLPSQTQLEVMRSALSGQTLAVLEEYLAYNAWTDALDLVRWLEAKVMRESDELTVSLGPGTSFDASRLGSSRPVNVVRDADICEGVQVRSHGQLYDYALQAKDLQ